MARAPRGGVNHLEVVSTIHHSRVALHLMKLDAIAELASAVTGGRQDEVRLCAVHGPTPEYRPRLDDEDLASIVELRTELPGEQPSRAFGRHAVTLACRSAGFCGYGWDRARSMDRRGFRVG